DIGNARRVAKRHGEDIRYCHLWKRWLMWDGRCWKEDNNGQVVQFVKETQANLYQQTGRQIEKFGPASDDHVARKQALAKLARLLKHWLAWEDGRRVATCLEMLKSEPGVPVLPEQLDSGPLLLNCLNGVLDLRTAQLRVHRREDLLTKLCPVEYDPQA